MPTRFKYTKVDPQSFSLTPVEILMATDAELNSYMGIKKYAPYRKEGKGKTWDRNRTARLAELKTKLKERGLGVDDVTRDGKEPSVKKRKGKKERQKEKALAMAANPSTDTVLIPSDKSQKESDTSSSTKQKREADEGETEAPAKKRRRRQHKHSNLSAAIS